MARETSSGTGSREFSPWIVFHPAIASLAFSRPFAKTDFDGHLRCNHPYRVCRPSARHQNLGQRGARSNAGECCKHAMEQYSTGTASQLLEMLHGGFVISQSAWSHRRAPKDGSSIQDGVESRPASENAIRPGDSRLLHRP